MTRPLDTPPGECRYLMRASSARVFAGLAEALGTTVLPATSVSVRFPLPPTSGNGC
jgi:hypothetical protein